MGKLRSDPKHHQYPHYHSKTQKMTNKTLKKPVKITYISSPLFVRACDACDFSSVVQQLTGKDSKDLIYESDLHNYEDHSTLYNQETPTWVMQGDHGGEYLHATTTATEEDGNGSSCYYNRSMDYSLEFNQDYY